MKFRHHRGGLRESLTTVVDIEPTLGALAALLKTPPSTITTEAYRYDERIGWDTYLVCIEGRICGFTDGPVRPASAG